MAYATADDVGNTMGNEDGRQVTLVHVLRAEGFLFLDLRSLDGIKRPVTALSKMG